MRRLFAKLSTRDRVALTILAILFVGFPLLVLGVTANDKAVRVAAFLPLAIPAVAICSLTLLLLTVAWHEFGHFVGGKLAGLRLDVFQVGPFGWFRRGDRFAAIRTGGFMQFSGFVGMSRPDGKVTVQQLRTLIAGGPISSILLSSILVAIVVKTGAISALTDGTKTQNILALLLLLFLYFALITVYASAIPRRVRGVETDAKVLIQSFREPDVLRVWFLLLEMQPKIVAGVRPRDWSEEGLQELLTSPALIGHRKLGVQYWAYFHYFDKGEYEKALDYIEAAFAATKGNTFSAPLLAGIANQCAFARAFINKDPENARVALAVSEKIPQSQKSPLLFARAAISLADNQHANAAQLIETGIEAHRIEHRSPTPSSTAVEDFWMKVRSSLSGTELLV